MSKDSTGRLKLGSTALYTYSPAPVSMTIMYIRVAPKKLKFCDSGQMMDEVIIKWFYFYYFLFHLPYTPAMPKKQNQKIRCAQAQIFFIERSQ